MKNKKLTAESPFIKRLMAYLGERFPLLSHGILIASYYSSNQFLAQVLNNPGDAMRYSPASLMGAVTIFMMFFHLRVFDEHKDYTDDCKFYPERILSRGLITLKHLKILGAGAITIELILSAFIGIPALTASLIALVFSVFMLKEFFIPKWLKKHFLIYTTSHMLIMPLFALVVFSFTTGKFPWEAPSWYYLYSFVGFFVTFNWEVSRKIRAPEDEVDGIDSYTRVFGTYGAAYMVILIRVIDTLMVSIVGFHLGLSIFFYAVLVVLFLVCLNGFFQFRFKTCTQTAKMMEVYAGIYIIAFDLTLAVEIIRANSIVF